MQASLPSPPFPLDRLRAVKSWANTCFRPRRGLHIHPIHPPIHPPAASVGVSALTASRSTLGAHPVMLLRRRLLCSPPSPVRCCIHPGQSISLPARGLRFSTTPGRRLALPQSSRRRSQSVLCRCEGTTLTTTFDLRVAVLHCSQSHSCCVSCKPAPASTCCSRHVWSSMDLHACLPCCAQGDHACRRSQRRWRFRFRRPAFALELHAPEVALQALHSWRSSGLPVKLILQALTYSYTMILVPCRWASASLWNSSEKIRCHCTLDWFMARASGRVRARSTVGKVTEVVGPSRPRTLTARCPSSIKLQSLKAHSLFTVSRHGQSLYAELDIPDISF